MALAATRAATRVAGAGMHAARAAATGTMRLPRGRALACSLFPAGSVPVGTMAGIEAGRGSGGRSGSSRETGDTRYAVGAAAIVAASAMACVATAYACAPSPTAPKAPRPIVGEIISVIKEQEIEAAAHPRSLSEPRDLLIIAGGNNDTSLKLQLDEIRHNPNRDIIVFTRSEVKPEEQARFRGRVKFVKVSDKDYQNEDTMRSIVDRELKKCSSPIANLSMVSCIGTAAPKAYEGETFESVNYYPLINLSKAVIAVGKDRKDLKSINIVNVSSIAPSIIGTSTDYSAIKEQADRDMLSTVESARSTLPEGLAINAYALRLGMVMDGEKHHLSPDEIAAAPAQLSLGSGDYHTPMTSSRNITVALRKLIESEGGESGIIDAADPETDTMNEVNAFFCARYGKTPRPFYLPHDVAKEATSFCPFGRACGYATRLAETKDREGAPSLDVSRFTHLVGEEAYDWRDSFPEGITPPELPIVEYAEEFAKRAIVNPAGASRVVFVALKHLPELTASAYYAATGEDHPLPKPAAAGRLEGSGSLPAPRVAIASMVSA